MWERKINIFSPFQNFICQSVLNLISWHTQTKTIQGILTWLSLAPNVSNWSNWKAFFGRILHINIGAFRLKSIAILGDCFLMASHYRNVGCGSNENVITASAEPVQGESSPTQTNIPSQFNLLHLWNDESWCPVERPHGDGSTLHCASHPICDNVTHFLQCYSQPIIIKS